MCDVTIVVNGEKLSIELKQQIIHRSINNDGIPVTNESVMMSNMIGALSKITPDDLKDGQEEDLHIWMVIRFIKTGKRQALVQIHKMKNVRKLFL